jgi:hypothetical protein
MKAQDYYKLKQSIDELLLTHYDLVEVHPSTKNRDLYESLLRNLRKVIAGLMMVSEEAPSE